METWTQTFKTLVESTRAQSALLQDSGIDVINVERDGYTVSVSSPFFTDRSRKQLSCRGYDPENTELAIKALSAGLTQPEANQLNKGLGALLGKDGAWFKATTR